MRKGERQRRAMIQAAPPAYCAPCRKQAHPSEKDAKLACREIAAHRGEANEVRYYQCEQGWWHWTRQNVGRP